jgi:predicted Zn-dependent protease
MPRQFGPLICILLLITVFWSCASAPPPRKATVSERIEFNRAVGSELAQQMVPQLTLKKDASIQNYLTRIAQRLTDKNPELHLPEVKVFLLQDTGRHYRSYALPGGRVYLSSGMLKTADYESQAAAMIAIELGHLLNEHVLNYLRKNPAGLGVQEVATLPGMLPLKTLQTPEDIDFFGKDGVFAFSAKDNDEAIASSIQILYDAGYDPRGEITFLQYMIDHPSRAPWDLSETNRLLELARKQISLLTPLRNPIVQTDDFELIRTQLQKL